MKRIFTQKRTPVAKSIQFFYKFRRRCIIQRIFKQIVKLMTQFTLSAKLIVKSNGFQPGFISHSIE